MHGVGGDDHAAQVEAGQQRGHGRDLVALGRHLALGDNGLAAVQGGGQQVYRGLAVGARAAHRLAVHRQSDQGFVLLDGIGGVAGEPGSDGVVQGVAVDAGEQSAERGSVGRGAGEAESGADLRVRVGGVPGDLREGSGSAEHRRQAQGQQDAGAVAAPARPAGIGHGGQHLGQRSQLARFDGRAGAGGVLALASEDVDQGGWHADATPGRSSVLAALIIWRRVSCFHPDKPPIRHQGRRISLSRQPRTHQPC